MIGCLSSVKLLPELAGPGHLLASLWKKTLEGGLVEGVCKACASKLGALDDGLRTADMAAKGERTVGTRTMGAALSA